MPTQKSTFLGAFSISLIMGLGATVASGAPLHEGYDHRVMEQIRTPIAIEPAKTGEAPVTDAKANEAQTSNSQIEELKRRIAALEQRQASSPLTSGFQWRGALELEAGYLRDYENESGSDLVVETAFLALEKQLQSNLIAAMSFLYEEDETSFDVDEVYLSYGISDSTAITGGQIYLPFGQYNTSVISDPLTQALGETLATTLMVTHKRDDVELKGYVFRGDSTTDSDAIENVGGRLTKSFSYSDGEGFFSLDFISNLLASDRLQDIQLEDRAAGLAGALHWQNNLWGATFEYLTAMQSVESPTSGFIDNEKPSSLQLECFFNHQIRDHKVTFAASLQQTREALLLGLPERRWIVSAALPLSNNLAVSAQVFADEDYGKTKETAGISGTGDDARGVLLQLAVEI